METDTIGILGIMGLVEGSEDDSVKLLVMPWNWPLSDYLETKRSRSEFFTTVLEVAEGIANGLHFLHSNELTHRCLTGANVKVNNDGEVKLMFTTTDYKFTEAPQNVSPVTTRRQGPNRYEADDNDLSYHNRPSRQRGIARLPTNSYCKFDEYPSMPTYLAPEFLLGRERLYTKEADIYSLGVLFWEITNDVRAYVCFTPLDPSSTMQEFLDYLDQGSRPKIRNPHCEPRNANHLMDVIENCWSPDPMERSSVLSVLRTLNKLKCVSMEVFDSWMSYQNMYSSMPEEAAHFDFEDIYA